VGYQFGHRLIDHNNDFSNNLNLIIDGSEMVILNQIKKQITVRLVRYN
jgi:hypothetical protein